jgi:hypothetical protein
LANDNRGEEATGGAVEGEPSVLPGGALTESGQSLRVAPQRPGIRLVRVRQRVRLGSLLLRYIQSLHDCLEDRVARWSEFLRHRSLEHGAIRGGVGVEGCAHAIQGCRPRVLNRRPDVPAPEAGHVLKP